MMFDFMDFQRFFSHNFRHLKLTNFYSFQHGLTSQPIGNSSNLVKKLNGTEQFENALTEFMSSNGSSTDHVRLYIFIYTEFVSHMNASDRGN